MKPTNEILSEIGARADAVPEGPWNAYHEFTPGNPVFNGTITSRNDNDFIANLFDCDEDIGVFIAHSRTDVPLMKKALQKAIVKFDFISRGDTADADEAKEALQQIQEIMNGVEGG